MFGPWEPEHEQSQSLAMSFMTQTLSSDPITSFRPQQSVDFRAVETEEIGGHDEPPRVTFQWPVKSHGCVPLDLLNTRQDLAVDARTPEVVHRCGETSSIYTSFAVHDSGRSPADGSTPGIHMLAQKATARR